MSFMVNCKTHETTNLLKHLKCVHNNLIPTYLSSFKQHINRRRKGRKALKRKTFLPNVVNLVRKEIESLSDARFVIPVADIMQLKDGNLCSSKMGIYGCRCVFNGFHIPKKCSHNRHACYARRSF
jgi:hypothetical protein